jgi:hypothetical protein
VLQGGHASWILVERVEKPTDNKTSWCFVITADARAMAISRKWPRRATIPRCGQRSFRECHGLGWGALGRQAETGPRSPKRHREGDRGRVRSHKCAEGTARVNHNASAIGHSVGRKVTLNWNISGVSQSGHWG